MEHTNHTGGSNNDELHQKITRWSAKAKMQKISIIAYPELPTLPGKVWIRTWSQKERLKKALQWGGFFWGLAFFCIAVPLLHFVLVPFFALFGPLAASYLYGQKNTILGGQGTCPKCQQVFEIISSKEAWPLRDSCTHCHTSVSISPTQ